ncbi:unnamed protein product, partial [Ectocarpus sp. 4 AP-2014]
ASRPSVHTSSLRWRGAPLLFSRARRLRIALFREQRVAEIPGLSHDIDQPATRSGSDGVVSRRLNSGGS